MKDFFQGTAAAKASTMTTSTPRAAPRWLALALGLALSLAAQVARAAPDIQLEQPAGAVLVDGGSTVAFGSTRLGLPVTKEFRVSNTGDQTLQVTALTLPAGFEHVGAFQPYSLAPGAAQLFSVRFLAHTVADSFPGTLVLASNDPDAEGSFEVGLTATATLGTYPMLDPSLDADGPGGPLLGGRVITPMNTSAARCMTLQADGKMLLGGICYGSSTPAFAIARYNVDGTLDATFGSGGKVFTNTGNYNDTGVEHLLVQADGKIVATGTGTPIGRHYVVRYLANGQLDTTFGDGGIVSMNTGVSVVMGHKSVVLPDGRLLSLGSRLGAGGREIVVARLTSTGALDTTFGSGGLVFLDISSGDDNCHDLALVEDGKIVLAGDLQNEVGRAWVLLRLNSTGALDTSFGSEGKVISDFEGADYCTAMVVQPDGKIISVGGNYTGIGTFSLCRHHSNGTLDAAFGSGGVVHAAYGTGSSRASSLALQSDGKIVVTGDLDSGGTVRSLGVLRLNTNGTQDSTFGSGGVYVPPYPILEAFLAVAEIAVQGDGRLVVAGSAYSGGSSGFLLMRLLVDGRPMVVTGGAEAAASPVVVAGTVNPKGITTSVWCEYGLTAGYGSSTSAQVLGYGTSPVAVAVQISGLTPGTPYHYRLVAQNGEGISYGVDGTFTLPGGTPRPDVLLEQLAGAPLVDGGGSVVDFGSARLGLPVGKAFRVSNTGQLPLQVTALTLSAGYEHVGAFEPYTLAAGAARDFSVRFLAHTVVGSFPGTLVLASDDPDDESSYEVGLTATATLGAYPMLDTALDADGPGGPLPGGRVITDMNNGFGQCVAVQADGKVLVGGAFYSSSPIGFAIARYHADGTLDTTFGSGGKVFTGVGSVSGVKHLLVQGDGKIVATGGDVEGALIVRYLPNGQLDASFGSGGMTSAANGVSWSSGVKSVLLQDGGLVCVGSYATTPTNNDVAVMRLTSTGQFDTSFGTSGRVVLSIGSGHDYAYDVALLADGKILVGGVFQNSGGYDRVLLRLTSAGVRDTSFGSGGLAITNFGPSDTFSAMVVQPDGKIVSVGFSNGTFDVCRHLGNGAVDASFGGAGAGMASTTLTGGNDTASAVALQRDGKIVVAGTGGAGYGGAGYGGGTGPMLGLARYNTDGTLDSTFGSGGIYTSTPEEAGQSVAGMALQGDGDILLAGYAMNGPMGNFLLSRFIPDALPAVTTGGATVGIRMVDVAGTVNSRGITTSAWFEYGTTAAYGASTSSQPVGYGGSATPVTARLTGLARDTLYHYRLVAQNGQGISHGADGTFTTGNEPAPEIVVEQLAGTGQTAGGVAAPYAAQQLGTSSAGRIFIIRNTGDAALGNVAVSLMGADAADFTLGMPTPAGTVAAGGSTTFILAFTPGGTTSRLRTATLRIASTDEDENPFDLTLTGPGLSPTADTDGDGLGDWAEGQYAALGFDWQVSQTALVAALNSGANAAGLHTQAQYDASCQAGRDDILGSPNAHGLYTPAQVQALHAPAPLIQRNAATGVVTLTLGLERSTTLQPGSFQGLPMSLPQISVNGEGRLQFQFNTGDNAAFFRLSAE